MAMKYGFVCTNYNNSSYTEAAVASLETGAVPPALIVVVDNCSRPDQVRRVEELQARSSGVELIKSDENVGYFSGLNIGIKQMLKRHPDIDAIVVGNNDLEFPAEFGTALSANWGNLAGYPVIAPNIVTFDGEHQNPHALKPVSKIREAIYSLYYSSYWIAKLIGFVAAKTSAVSRRRDTRRHEQEGVIFMGMGACYVLTRTFLDEFRELWAPTFLMHEEYFLSLQLAEKGCSIYYCPGIRVYHHHHASVGLVSSKKMWSIARQAHMVYRRYVKVFGPNPAFPVPK